VGAAIAAMATEDGFVTLRSAHDFKTTLDRLLQILKVKDVTFFVQIDHAPSAKRHLSPRIIVPAFH
jgi:hypothetical protein